MAKPPSRLSRLKSWPGWLLLAVVVAAALAVGVARSGGTRSSQERIDEISQQLACPICNGQSVYESENPTSQAIRTEIGRLVREGQLNDDQILMRLEQSYSGSMLRPRGDGVDALIWALPAAAAVICAAGLVVVFRRWRGEAATAPDAADRALVDEALRRSDLEP